MNFRVVLAVMSAKWPSSKIYIHSDLCSFSFVYGGGIDSPSLPHVPLLLFTSFVHLGWIDNVLYVHRFFILHTPVSTHPLFP